MRSRRALYPSATGRAVARTTAASSSSELFIPFQESFSVRVEVVSVKQRSFQWRVRQTPDNAGCHDMEAIGRSLSSLMWPYLLVFLAALVVDTIPVFAPPAWILLVVLLVKFKLNPWLTVIVGVTGSTIGRYILTRYIPKISSRLVNRREDANLRYIGRKIGKAKWSSSVFVFVYTLTPLSTTALFTAVAMARTEPWHILAPFFLARLISDGVLVFSGK